MLKTLLLFTLTTLTSGFTLQNSKNSIRFSSLTRLQAGPQPLEELLASPEQWDPIKNSLNAVPAFACANAEGQPLQYSVADKPLAFFFLDINAAKKELEKAKEETKLDGLNLVPFPLGEVFEMGAKQMAIVIPSQESLEAAGAPKGMNPMGQQVPLFGCMDMTEDRPDGSSLVPLFFNEEQAKEAMGMALQGLGEDEKAKFDITIVPLGGAVQMQATSEGKKSFNYVPANTSLEYLRSLE